MKKNTSFWKSPIFWIAMCLVVIGGIIIIGYIIILSKNYSVFGNGNLQIQDTGAVGDFIGGLVGSIWSLAGVILFFAALQFQRKDLESQREVLTLQKDELQGQRNEFIINRITNIIYKQLEIFEEKERSLYLTRPFAKGVKEEFGIEVYNSIDYIRTSILISTSKEEFNNNQYILAFNNFIRNHSNNKYLSNLENGLNYIENLIQDNQGKMNQYEQLGFYKLIYFNFNLSHVKEFLIKVQTIQESLEEYKSGLNKEQNKFIIKAYEDWNDKVDKIINLIQKFETKSNLYSSKKS